MSHSSAARSWIRLAPTGAGWTFLLAVIALVLAAINYGNNVLYALAFFLAATGSISAWSAARAVAALHPGAPRLEPAFAGEPTNCSLVVTEAAGRARPALRLEVAGRGAGRPVALPAGSGAALGQDLATGGRGLMTVRGLRIVSTWPFGLFRAWYPLPQEAAALIYPAPERDGPVPHDTWRAAARRRAEAEAFSHFRDYAAGDPPARIHWPALARSDTLVTKLFDGAQGGTAVWLDWRDAGAARPEDVAEATLSRLCRWVLAAEGHDLDYGLRLPGLEIPPARGPVQRSRCLDALARHVLPAAAPVRRPLAWWRR